MILYFNFFFPSVDQMELQYPLKKNGRLLIDFAGSKRTMMHLVFFILAASKTLRPTGSRSFPH
jgi:hypothetical protein